MSLNDANNLIEEQNDRAKQNLLYTNLVTVEFTVMEYTIK